MKKKEKKKKYESPMAKSMEMDFQAIICQSEPSKWETDTDPEEDRF